MTDPLSPKQASTLAHPPSAPVGGGSWAAPPLNRDLAMRYIELVALGKDGPEISALLPELPLSHFLVWLAQHKDLAIAYKTAREISAFVMEDEALHLARRAQRNPQTAAHLRANEALTNQLRWSASKRNPGAFSEKASVSLVVPVHISTPLDLGRDTTQDGSAGFPDIYTLEAEVVREVGKEELTDEQIEQGLRDASEQLQAQPGDPTPCGAGEGAGPQGAAGSGGGAQEEGEREEPRVQRGTPPGRRRAAGGAADRGRAAQQRGPAREGSADQQEPKAVAKEAGRRPRRKGAARKKEGGAEAHSGEGDLRGVGYDVQPEAPRILPAVHAGVQQAEEGGAGEGAGK